SAEAYAAKTGDTAYVTALGLFIAEEQRHGRDLGRFLDLAGIDRLRSTFADAIFRWLRHLAGLQLSIVVLLTAEIIAMVYYAALRDATRSILLRRLCDQILRDEVEHLRFQGERLAILRRRWPRLLVHLGHAAHRAFMAVVALVVWC